MARPAVERVTTPGFTAVKRAHPWVTDDDLAFWCGLRAAARTPIARATSIARRPPDGRIHKAQLPAISSAAMLHVDAGGARFGAQDPKQWWAGFDVNVAVDGDAAGVQAVDGMTWVGGGALNAGHRENLRRNVVAALGEPLDLTIDRDVDHILANLDHNLSSSGLIDNGTEEGFSFVEPWFAHGARIELPTGGGNWLRASAETSDLVAEVSPEGLAVDLSGGWPGLDSWLVIAGDLLYLHAPEWESCPEPVRQRVQRAAVLAISRLVRGADGDRPDVTAAVGSWRKAVVDHIRRDPALAVVPCHPPGELGAAMTLAQGRTVPVALVVTGPPVDEDDAAVRLSGLASTAFAWTTGRRKRWQWRYTQRQQHTVLWYYVASYLNPEAERPEVFYGDSLEAGLSGILAPDELPDLIPAWAMAWGMRDGAWVAALTGATKLQYRLEHGDELAAYLCALAWLIRRTTPGAEVDVVRLTL